MIEFAHTFAQFQDHLAPRLDVYEQAIYLYLLRHTHVEGKREAVIGFKSARKKLAFGTGKAGTPPSEHVVYEKLRGLEQKGCVKILSSERAGTRVEVFLRLSLPGLFQWRQPSKKSYSKTKTSSRFPKTEHSGARGVAFLLLLGEIG